MSLTFYTNPVSHAQLPMPGGPIPMSRGRMVLWMLEEIGAPYETVIVEYGPAMKGADYLAINPMGKIPAIMHEGVAITEAAAIITYLADRFPASGLAPPPGDPRRGAFYRWMFFGAGPLEAGIINTVMRMELPPGGDGLAGYGSFSHLQDVLETQLGRAPYILGDAFSAVDLYLASQLGFGMMMQSVSPRPVFSDYVKRIRARPAALRAREIDERLAAQRG
jgi:glutathione S-transferase